MADVHSALLEYLRSRDDEAARTQLEAALGEIDLASARTQAMDDAGSAEAQATVVGRLALDGVDDGDVIDAAKAAAQRSPRDASGNGVALLAGAVVWHVSGQPKLAEPYFRRVRRNDASNSDVVAFYREMFSDQTAASQLMQVLVQARRASSEPEVRFALAEEMAELAETKLESADRAIEVWRSVMREDGYDRRASEALQRLYGESGKWTALVELLKDELDRVEDTPENSGLRIEKLLEIAALYRDRLRLDTMALATLQRILDIDPRHEASLESLAETYAKAGRYNDLLGVYEKRIDAARETNDSGGEIELLRRVASIWVEKLGNPQRALEPLAKVLELASGDREARDMLARIHEQRRDWRALIALRREELDAGSGEEALALRIELARLAEERLGDRREAIAAWNEVLEEHGDVDVALEALVNLYERESRWSGAAEILHRQVARTDDRDRAVALLTQLGGIYSDRLRSRDDSITVWQEVIRLAPGHDRATRMLRDAYIAAGRWDDLTALYESQENLEALVDVLQSAADRVPDVEERVSLYRRVATMCRDRLGQPERALKALERTLAIQPDNLQVARELLPIYREQANWARLLNTHEVLLRAAQDDDERLELIAAMQQVAEHELGSPSLTLQWAARGYELRPGDESLRDGLETAAERSDGWDDLTRIFEARIEQDDVGDDERLLLLDKLATVARDRLFKPDDAQRYFRRIIALDPHNEGAMAALEDIYSSTRRWDDLSEVYRKRLEVTEDPAAQLVTLRALARIQEEHIGDLDGAIESHQAILEVGTEDEHALESLARIHRNRGGWEALAEVLRRKLDQMGEGLTQTPVMFELAQVQATRLRQSEQAIEGFLAVLDLEPVHRPTVEALEALRQAEPTLSLAIMRGLLPYYRRVDDRAHEAEAMEVIVDAEDDPERKLGLLEQLSGIYERMAERQADALRIRTVLFEAQPQSWDNRQTLKRIARDLGQINEVARSYEYVLRSVAERSAEAEREGRTLSRDEANLRRDLLLELAALLRDDLDRAPEAERAYREVLEHDETHQGAYEALEALLRARQADDELVRLYRRRVDVVFNQREQRELLSRIVEISRTVLNDRETAIRTAEELLDLIPDDLATIELLAQMYAEGNDPRDHQQLEEILGRWAELSEDDGQRHALLCRRAALRMQYLGDAYGAVDLLGQVVGENPDHMDARALLEELLAINEVQMQVCALLEPIYVRHGDHHGHVRVLSVRRAHAEANGSIDEAVALLLTIARIEESDRGDMATAFGAIREAYLMDPRRADTREEVARLGVELGRDLELVEVWRSALASDKVVDRALQIDLTQRVAVLLDERLKDEQGARQAYTDLLALDPPDAAIAHRAVRALCRLHLEAGDGVALVEAQRALLRFTDAASDQVQIRLEIAAIQEQQLGDRVGAALTYSEVLDLEPDNMTALEALERLFLEEAEWERLCEVLEHRISVTTDPRGRALVWRQVGEIQRDQLRATQPAIEAFQSVLAQRPGREETMYALESLVALNEALERWPDVEDGLRRLVGLTERENERVELLTRTAEVVGQKLDRDTDALELLKRVLDLSPTDQRARSLVGGYLEQEETRERSIRILTPLYEAEQNWPALLGLEELQARHQPSGRRRLQALLQVANTSEERIQDPGRAFTVLCEAMAEAADQPELAEILDRVERLGADPERAEALLGAYTDAVDHILDSDLQVRVLRSMGRVALERLGRLDSARAAFERVAELAPGDDDATDALEQIYLRQDDYESLAHLLTRRAERAQYDPQRDGYLKRAAEIYRTQLDRAEDAILLYERLSSDALVSAEIQTVLEPLYEQTGRYRELAAHLNRQLPRLQGDALVDSHLRLGRLYGEQLDDPEEGIRHLSTALRLDPNHAVATDDLNRYLEDESMRIRVAELLEPVFMAVQDWPRLVRIQEIRLADSNDPNDRVKILLRIAQIEEEQLEDLDRALASYTRVFNEDPTNQYVRDQLHRLSHVLQRLDGYAQTLADFVTSEGAGDDSDENLAIVREAAEIWALQLRMPARAVPLLQRLVDARPHDETAFPALERALSDAEMWRELCEAYWREADATTEEDRQIELLKKLATVAADLLEDQDEAGRAYHRVLEIRPDHTFARGRLEQILEQLGRHADLLEILRDRLSRTEHAPHRTGVYLRIAELQSMSLSDPDGAIDSLEALFVDNPGDEDGIAALERIGESRLDQRPRVVGILRPIYETTMNAERIVALDEWQLGYTEDPATRHEIFREMASFLAREGGIEPAFRVLCRAIGEPGPGSALQALDEEVERLARQLGLPGALSEAQVNAAMSSEAISTDDDRRVELLVRAAELQLEIGEPSVAVDILNRALDLSAEHERALALLDECLVRLGYHEDLRRVLERRVDVAADDRVRIDLLRRLARLLEETLVQAEAAEKAWRDLLDIESQDQEALSRLSHAYEASGSTSELLEVLERQVEASNDLSERRDLRMHLASILREAVKDRGEEIEVLRALLAEAPTDDDALAALARALIAEERHAEAADVLHERATLAGADERKAGLLLEAARIYAGPLGDLAGALERYEGVLQLVPGQDGAVADLVSLSKKSDSSESAATLVVPQLSESGRFSELADVYLARAELTEDPEERGVVLRDLARIRLEKLDDPTGSLDARMSLIDTVSADELSDVLEEAGRLSVQLGVTDEYISALGERSGDADREPPARLSLARAAAALAEQVLGEPRRSIELLAPMLDAGLADVALCDRVEQLGRATGDLELLERTLRESITLRGEPGSQAEALVRLGAVELELDAGDKALEAYRDALDLQPAYAPAVAGLEHVLERAGDEPPTALLDALEGAYQAGGNRSGLASITRVRLRGVDEHSRARLLEQLATLCEEGGGTPEQAIDAWGDLLALDPESAQALERILAVARGAGLIPHAAAKMTSAIAAGVESGHQPTTLTLATASVLLRDLGDAAGAVESLDGVLSEHPEHPEALELAVEAARASGNPESLHAALVRSARAQANPDSAVELWRDAAQVAEVHLARGELAITDLEEVLALDESHEESWQKLLALRTSAGDHEKLAEALGRRVMIAASPEERRDLRYRLANLLADKLDRAEDAVAIYHDMLADKPDDGPASQELEVLLRRLERWSDVRETLEHKLTIAEGSTRVDILEELARLAEDRLDDAADAIERHQQVLLEKPGHTSSEQALERLLTREERWQDLAELLEQRMTGQRDGGDSDGFRETASRLAELLAERLEDADKAQEILNQLLEFDPGYVPAILALASVYEVRGDEGAMRLTLQRAAGQDPAGVLGAQLEIRLARVADDKEERRAHLERALEHDPGNPEAAKALLQLSRADKRWEQVAYLLELAAGRTEDDSQRRELTLERVDVLLERVHDSQGALQSLARMYEQIQDDPDINRRIADALFMAERFDEAAGMYGWLVEVGRRGKRSKALAHHLTRLARISLGQEDANGAREQLLEAYRIDTTNVETMMALGRLHEAQSEWQEALKIYRSMLLQNADQSGLLRRGDLYLSLARAHVELGEGPKAKAMLRRGLEEDSDHPDLAKELDGLD